MNRYADSLYRAFIQEALAAEIEMLEPPPPWPGKFGVVASRFLRYPLWMHRNMGDINHILDHSYAHLCRTSRGKTLVTVHDLAPLLYSRKLSFSGIIWRVSIQGIIKADKIIADSQFTADELTRIFRQVADITVIPLGVSEAFRPLPADERQHKRTLFTQQARPIILHVGNWQPRKNPMGILKALAVLRQRHIPLQLIQAGANPSREILAEIARMDLLDQVLFMGQVREDELVMLYNIADLLLFPSFYEGFGLPVLEAMACGTPVVTSNVASLPETAGEAAVLVNPADEQSIADGVATAISDKLLRERLIERGLQRASTYSWANTARQVYRQYQALK